MRLLILDRDGVINEESDAFITSPEQWQPIPGSLEAIARANAAGYRVVVLTNQSALKRRILDFRTLSLIHQKMHQYLADLGGQIDAIFLCPHGPDDGCHCRKPNPGLFHELAARLHVSLSGVPAVGDRLTDVMAARAAGARPILVETGRGRETLGLGMDLSGIGVYRDLAAVVDDLPELRSKSETVTREGHG